MAAATYRWFLSRSDPRPREYVTRPSMLFIPSRIVEVVSPTQTKLIYYCETFIYLQTRFYTINFIRHVIYRDEQNFYWRSFSFFLFCMCDVTIINLPKQIFANLLFKSPHYTLLLLCSVQILFGYNYVFLWKGKGPNPHK